MFSVLLIRLRSLRLLSVFFFQAEDGILDSSVTGVQTCALPIASSSWAPTTFSPSHSARALSRRVSKPCSAAAADFRSSVLRGHVRPARSGADARGAGAAARSARAQRRIVGDGARHDRARRDAGAGVIA